MRSGGPFAGALPAAIATGSPKADDRKALQARSSSASSRGSQSHAWTSDRKDASGDVSSSMSAKKPADRSASAISASVSASIVRMDPAARVARFSGSLRNSAPPYRSAVSNAWRTQAPKRLSPQRRWWSRKLSGAPAVKVCSQSDTLASSTASGFLSTPWTQRLSTMRRTMRRSSSCAGSMAQPNVSALSRMVRRTASMRSASGET